MKRREFLRWSLAGSAAAAAGIVGYTFAIEPHWLEIVEQSLPIAGLPRTLVDQRLVHLSDLHVGPRVSDEYLIESLRRARALAAHAGEPALVLSHNPDSLDHAGWSGYRGWVLAGHTHGGQCKPPFLPPPLLPVQNKRYTAGAIPLADGRAVYISRGIGHLIPVRFNVRPEITSFTLASAPIGSSASDAM